LIKTIAGIAPQRSVPPFARPTFRAWFKRRDSRTTGQRRVLFWPDTFSNYLRSAPAIAAVQVLESAGYQVDLPRGPLCCGRPLYDWGMLDRAKALWRRTLDTLRADIRDGVPLVGVEPSCVSAFRDELPGLFPDDEDAARLARQTFMLTEFLDAEGFRPPRMPRQALVHGHCHHKSVMTMRTDETMLRAMGIDYRLLDSGCCGMAGGFGFEREKYDLSVRIGERVLLPAVRAASGDTMIIASGFSCQEQIAQLTGRKALHLAEVVQLALQGEANATPQI
jgi:Fe-S oxidoreductase